MEDGDEAGPVALGLEEPLEAWTLLVPLASKVLDACTALDT